MKKFHRWKTWIICRLVCIVAEEKSILTIAFKVALNWRGPAPDWPLRSQCLAVLVWSPGMQQYARNDECRLFRFASKLVFFTTIIHIFWRQIFASLFNAEPGHLGQHIQTRKNPPLTFQKCKSDKLYLLPSMQSFVYLFFSCNFSIFVASFMFWCSWKVTDSKYKLHINCFAWFKI